MLLIITIDFLHNYDISIYFLFVLHLIKCNINETNAKSTSFHFADFTLRQEYVDTNPLLP